MLDKGQPSYVPSMYPELSMVCDTVGASTNCLVNEPVCDIPQIIEKKNRRKENEVQRVVCRKKILLSKAMTYI